VDDYFEAFFTWNPSQGTAAGFHQYDAKLEDRSAPALARRIETVKLLAAEDFSRIPTTVITPAAVESPG
jgi:hypothetical protein